MTDQHLALTPTYTFDLRAIMRQSLKANLTAGFQRSSCSHLPPPSCDTVVALIYDSHPEGWTPICGWWTTSTPVYSGLKRGNFESYWSLLLLLLGSFPRNNTFSLSPIKKFSYSGIWRMSMHISAAIVIHPQKICHLWRRNSSSSPLLIGQCKIWHCRVCGPDWCASACYSYPMRCCWWAFTLTTAACYSCRVRQVFLSTMSNLRRISRPRVI